MVALSQTAPPGPSQSHQDIPLDFLASLGRRLSDPAALEANITPLLADLSHLGQARGAALFLPRQGGEGLDCRASFGVSAYPELWSGPAGDLVDRCQRDRAAMSRDDLPADAEAPRSLVCVPLLDEGSALGVLALVGGQRGDLAAVNLRLLQTVAGMMALALSKTKLSRSLTDHDGVSRELELAAEIQRKLLPDAPPGSFPIYGLNKPIRKVSGDFFDFFPVGERRIPFALGDVSGKGFNAALLMAKAASLFRCLAKTIEDPAELLAVINREICETASHGMFVTMVAGVYDPKSGEVVFANAGHEPPIWRGPDRVCRPFPASRPPLGLLPDLGFERETLGLGGGEFWVFTDGLTEYRYGSDEALGVEGLIQLVEGLADLPLAERIESLLAELDHEGWEARDDLTVLGIDDAWVRPTARIETPDALVPAAAEPLWELRFPAELSAMKEVRARVRQTALDHGFSQSDADDFMLATDEACKNVVVHAYGPGRAGDMVVRLFGLAAGLAVEIEDFAPAVDPALIKPRELDDIKPGKLGTHFMKAIMDRVEFRPDPGGTGNVLRMTKERMPRT